MLLLSHLNTDHEPSSHFMTSSPNQRVHAFSDDLLGDLDATAIAAQIKQGKFSAAEVTAAVIKRIEKVNPILNAVAHTAYLSAQDSASNRTYQDGQFAGLPMLIKDNIMVKNMPTGNGMLALNARRERKDSHITRLFRDLGFTIAGKSQLSELGLSPTAIFKDGSSVHNPWHTDYSSGASSAGAAALVAAGALPMAHANDGGGSIRIPAACCGLIGLKPTRGRIIRSESSRAMPIDVVCDGVVTRSVRDTANFFAAAESIYHNRKLPLIGQVSGPSKRRLRIGYLLDSVTPEPTDSATRAAVEKTAKQLAANGHQVELAQIPDIGKFQEHFLLYYAFLFYCQTEFGKLIIDNQFKKTQVDDLTRGFAKQFKQHWYRFPFTLYGLQREAKRFRSLFRRYDVVMSPVLTRTTPKVDYLDPNLCFDEVLERMVNLVGFTPMNNAAGLPGISLPMAQTDIGLPIGVQLSADQGHERTLLELAFELEQDTHWPGIRQTG